MIPQGKLRRIKREAQVQKNEITQLLIEDMSSEGFGVGHAGGMAVFVKDAVAGDLVRARIVKVKKHYAYARLEELLSPGADRVEPRCPCARSCGGCQIQELSYSAQLRLKERKVRENLIRIGGLKLDPGEDSDGTMRCEEAVFQPIIGMEDPWHYRNKAQFPVGADRDGRITAGFYAGRTHTIIDNHRCVIGIEENQAVIGTVISWMEQCGVRPYSESGGDGTIRHVMTRAGFATGELMVVIVAAARELKEEQKLVSMLLAALPDHAPSDRSRPCRGSDTGKNKRFRITGIILNTNPEKTNVILGREMRVLYGHDYIEDRIGNLTYRIAPGAFYQVNPVQTAVLYQTALDYAGLTGKETVWDLYCGTGTISLFLAQRAKRVIGVEVIPEAVRNARQNAELNHIDNCEFIAGKAEDLAADLPGADVIVVDPPRKGLDRVVIDVILRACPVRIVYVSCDSATLARDLALLTQGGYRIRKVQPVDQFCHSVHVETVCLLTHKG